MQLISVYETFLYYCCLLIIAKYIMGYKSNDILLRLSFFVFIPLTIFAVNSNTSLYHTAYILFVFAQFLLIKLIFKVRLQLFIFLYIMLYCTNMIVIALLITLFPDHTTIIDIVVNSLSFVVCLIVCLTKTRYKIQHLFSHVPTRILIFSTLLLITSAILSASILGKDIAIHSNIFSLYIHLATFGILSIVSIVTPILIANAISNNELKELTENYEQQIHAQAEHYKNLAAANLELRRFKHDFQNTRIAIGKLLADGDHAQALTLMQQCGNAMERPGGLALMFDTGNGIADALLTDKQTKADACNARIVFSGAITPNYLSPTDLCVILGNTLDNAIEACEKINAATAKIIRVNCSCSNGFLFLSVCNPIGEKVVIRDNHIATTKENKTLHGFGLYSLQSVVKRYDGEVKLSSTEDAFTVEIALCLTSVKEPTIQHAN